MSWNVAMDDARPMGLVERVGDLDRHLHGFGELQRTAIEPLRERLSVADSITK